MRHLVAVSEMRMGDNRGDEDLDRKPKCNQTCLVADKHKQAAAEFNYNSKSCENGRRRQPLLGHVGRGAGLAGDLEVAIQNVQ